MAGPVRGTVAGLERQVEQLSGDSQATTTVWTFRLQTQDGGDRRTRLLPLGMRAATILGVLSDGDEVSIGGPLSASDITWITQLDNLTTGGVVRISNVRWIWPPRQIARLPPGPPDLPGMRGEVAGLDKRTETAVRNITEDNNLSVPYPFKVVVWSFRVYVRAGTESPGMAVPVEIRASNEISGTLRDGDEIQIDQTWRRKETLHPSTIRNTSTGELLNAGGYPYYELDKKRNMILYLTFFVLFFPMVMIFADPRANAVTFVTVSLAYLLSGIMLEVFQRRVARKIGDAPDWGWR